MTVMFVDKRRSKEKISSVELTNGFWFDCLDLDGMSDVVNIQHTNDELNITPSKAKQIAEIILKNKERIVLGKGRDLPFECLIDFLENCNGFRTY